VPKINEGEVPASYDSGNYQLQLRSGAAFRMIVFNYPATPLDLENYTDAYVQDSWRMGSRLTLNLGVRYAHDLGFAPPQCRTAADPPGDVANPARCFPLIEEPEHGVATPPRGVRPIWRREDNKGAGWGRPDDALYRHDADRELESVQPDHLRVARSEQRAVYQPGEVNLDPNVGIISPRHRAMARPHS
jgi:hypothetical protein